jgi:hypothetical protein
MLYTWGYYGNDGFITDMIRRNVIDPSGQGYGAAGPALIDAVDQVASSLLAGNYLGANRILRALGTRDVLVRGDISPYDPVASLVSPQALGAALRSDPALELVRRFGPLSLYRLRAGTGVLGTVTTHTPYATTRSRAPNLLDLSALPKGTAIITHSPIAGVPALVQVPSIAAWKLHGGQFRTVLRLPSGRSYTLHEVGTQRQASTAISLRVGSTTTVGVVRISLRSTSTSTIASLSTPATVNELPDGSFTSGDWQRVGNCDAVPGTHPDLVARLGSPPGGDVGKALVLSASGDIACESKAVQWHGGPVLLTLTARRVAGSPPAICVWEVGPNRCANLPTLSESRRWKTYQQVVIPPHGTRRLQLFVDAYGSSGGVQSVAAYAAIGVRRVPNVPVALIVARSTSGARHPPVLTTADSTYSDAWVVNGFAQHVPVDGMANGWLSTSDRPLAPHDTTASMVAAGFIATLLGVAMTLLLTGSVVLAARRATGARRAPDLR